MNKKWWIVPMFLLACYLGWVVSNRIQAKRESDAFHEMKEVNLGVLNASDAENRMRALRALVPILGGGVRYGVKWKTNKSGKWVDYELIAFSPVSSNGLWYCEISDKSMQCFAFYNLKPDTLAKIANNEQSAVDPLEQLEKQGYKKQRTRRENN